MLADTILHWLSSFGELDVRTSLGLAAMYVLCAFLPVPRTVLCLGSGAAFGMNAIAVIVPSTTLGCVLAFLLARTLLRDWVARQIDKRRSWRVIAQAIDAEGWRIAALLRFGGPIPNAAQNYMFGLTQIELLPYTLITLVFTFPQIVLYTYIGASGRSILEDGALPLNRLLVLVAALVILAVLYLVARRIRVILAQPMHPPERA